MSYLSPQDIQASSSTTRSDRTFNYVKGQSTSVVPSYASPSVLPKQEAGSLAYSMSNATLYVSDGLGWNGISPTPVNATYITVSYDPTLTNSRVLTAGTGITLVDGGAGESLTINATADAPSTAEYVVMTVTGSLPNSRTLTAGTNLTLVDGGAGEEVVLSLSPNVTTTSIHLTSTNDASSTTDSTASISTTGGLSVTKSFFGNNASIGTSTAILLSATGLVTVQNTANSANYLDTTASVSTAGGLSVAKALNALNASVGSSTAVLLSATGLVTVQNTANSANYLDTTASVSTAGGLSVAKALNALNASVGTGTPVTISSAGAVVINNGTAATSGGAALYLPSGGVTAGGFYTPGNATVNTLYYTSLVPTPPGITPYLSVTNGAPGTFYTTTAAQHTLFSYTIPGGTLANGQCIVIRGVLMIYITNFNDEVIVTINLNGTNVYNYTIGQAGFIVYQMAPFISVISSTGPSAQTTRTIFYPTIQQGNSSYTGTGTTTISQASPITINITGQNNTDSPTSQGYQMQWCEVILTSIASSGLP